MLWVVFEIDVMSLATILRDGFVGEGEFGSSDAGMAASRDVSAEPALWISSEVKVEFGAVAMCATSGWNPGWPPQPTVTKSDKEHKNRDILFRLNREFTHKVLARGRNLRRSSARKHRGRSGADDDCTGLR